MQLTLLDKTYTTAFIPGLVLRKLTEYQLDMDLKNLKPQDIDKLVELVCLSFNNQFTVDDFYNGSDRRTMMDEIFRILYSDPAKPSDDKKK